MYFSVLSLIHTWGIIASFFGMQKESEKNAISITFDDGPHPTRTKAILDILHEHHVPATFFVLGSRIGKNETLLTRMRRDGHTVGNHSFSHANFVKITTPEILSQVLLTNLKIWTTIGVWPEYFRFPYGNIDSRIAYVYHGATVAWNVDAYDWKAKSPHALAVKIVSQVHTGSIILLHDIKEDTVKALPEILEILEKKGYRFVSLDTLLRETREKRDTIFYSSTKSRSLPPLHSLPGSEHEIYHPRGTEASEETLRW